MLSRTLYEAFRTISSGVYSDGRPIPPWDRGFSTDVERDEAIWAALADVATFAAETSQQLAAMPEGTGSEIGGVLVVRAASSETPYSIYADSTRADTIGRSVSRSHAVELIVRRRATPVIPPLSETAA